MVSMSWLTAQWTSWPHTAICSANPGWSSLSPLVWSASLPPSWLFSASSSLSSCLAYFGQPHPKCFLSWPAAAASLVAAETGRPGPNPPHLLPRCWCPCLRLQRVADDRTIRWDLQALSLHSCDPRWAQEHVLHPAECGLICLLAMRQGFGSYPMASMRTNSDLHTIWDARSHQASLPKSRFFSCQRGPSCPHGSCRSWFAWHGQCMTPHPSSSSCRSLMGLQDLIWWPPCPSCCTHPPALWWWL